MYILIALIIFVLIYGIRNSRFYLREDEFAVHKGIHLRGPRFIWAWTRPLPIFFGFEGIYKSSYKVSRIEVQDFLLLIRYKDRSPQDFRFNLFLRVTYELKIPYTIIKEGINIYGISMKEIRRILYKKVSWRTRDFYSIGREMLDEVNDALGEHKKYFICKRIHIEKK